MVEPAKIERPTQLLVEGNDQKNFFGALISHLNIQGVQIQNFGGVDELGRFLRVFVRAPDFDIVASIGVIRDAEISAADAFRSVQSSLRNAGLGVPENEKQRASAIPEVRVIILPGGNQSGMLETLLCKSFEESPVNDCIDEFIDCARGIPDTEIERLDKARAHAYLATRPHPHVSVGVAAQKGYWLFGHEAFADVRAFLRSL